MFRFTIRELLLVTVIAGVAAAWWIDRNQIAGISEQRDLWTFRAQSAAELFRMNGGEVEWDDASISITQIDSAGRRRCRMILRHPSTAPDVMVNTVPGGPATAPVVRFTTRKSSGNPR